MVKIAVYTGSRADYSLLEPVIKALGDIAVVVRTEGLFRHETSLLAQFTAIKPDLIIILGDRYESLIAATVATVLCIPIAHFHGGEITEGANDDLFRHAITKLAYWHFVADDLAAKRVATMNESPDRIFALGAPGLDALIGKVMTRDEVEQEIDMEIHSPSALVCLHPETLSVLSIEEQFGRLLNEIVKYSTVIISGCNADIGGYELNALLANFASKRKRCLYRKSYGRNVWNNLMRHCDVLVGNSSSFVFEGLTLKKNILMIGDRQKGRWEEAKEAFSKKGFPYGEPGKICHAIVEKLLCLEIPFKPKKIFYEHRK